MLPNLSVIESVPGLRLFENLDELEIEVGGHILRVNYAVNHLPTGIEGMSTYDQDRQEILVTLDHNTYLALNKARRVHCFAYVMNSDTSACTR
jgi:hypothetical protein